MAKQFLDLQGLSNFWGKVKQFVLDNKVEVDGELSSTSTNPVENGVITTKLDEMQDEYEGNKAVNNSLYKINFISFK